MAEWKTMEMKTPDRKPSCAGCILDAMFFSIPICCIAAALVGGTHYFESIWKAIAGWNGN